jgi:hypothetical protein
MQKTTGKIQALPRSDIALVARDNPNAKAMLQDQ